MSNPWNASLTLCLASCVLAGCASVGPPPPSGFLGNLEEFQVDPRDASLLWWERADFDWRRYRGVMLDPVAVRFHPLANDRQVRPDELVRLTDAFREAVVAELGQDCAVTDEPAPDVLRVRCAITDVVPVQPVINLVSELAVFVAVDIGGAAIEVEFLDSTSGERLAAGVDQKFGRPIDCIGGLTRLGHARRAFDAWARELHVALETNP